ncbi:cation-independent mannose-6-phosphate receptor isoform X2 [Diachasmimorpha longicaudata]|uniref:cation-independent mannose-6-phosphate receptor isoform X2 n=1 Tax=Diachasmimorpha longicaudata TaxID=58733 RepID=UPI0030B900CA
MGQLILLALLTSSLSIIGANMPTQHPCQYTDPSTGIKYDFTSLILPTEDYSLRNDGTNETVKLQLCHVLHDQCKEDGTSSVCLQSGEKHISIGTYPPTVLAENGSIAFHFSGDPCMDGKRYTLRVIMQCDYSESDEKPYLFPYGKGQCDVYVIWKNILACGTSPKVVNCTIANQAGDVVDLTRLMSQESNYEIPTAVSTRSMILNVCHSVIPGYGVVCPVNSGACLRDTTNSSARYINIGDVQPPQLINGTVALEYTLGAICPESADHLKTTIFFICDLTSHNTHPVLINSTGCHYELLWKTVAACSEKQLEKYRLDTASPCKVVDPVTNFEYNLESLKAQDLPIPITNGSYKLSICRPLNSVACGPHAGVCRSPNLTVGGQANSQLMLSSTGPYLNYTNGSICENEKRHYTIIEFMCSKEEDKGEPKIVTDEGCLLKIQWPTSLACGIPTATTALDPPLSSTHQPDKVTPTPPPTSITLAPNSTDKSPSNRTIDTDSLTANESSHGTGLIIFFVIFITLGLVAGIFLANPVRRSNLYATCRSFFHRRMPTGMPYSQVNSVEETNLLLDAADTCCQSDSDDDLLRI